MHLLAQADPVTVWGIFSAFFSRVDNALSMLLSAPNQDWLTIQIIAIVGLSEAVGQSVVLFANRVRPTRFLLSLLAAMALFVIGYFIWTSSLWLIMGWIVNDPIAWSTIAAVLAISYIPLIFAFLGFLPYAGQPILQLLYVISFYYLVVLLVRVSPLDLGYSLFAAVVGLVIVLLLRATVGKGITRVADKVLGAAAGTSLKFDLDDAVNSFADPDEEDKPHHEPGKEV